jgi:hypothetical protein
LSGGDCSVYPCGCVDWDEGALDPCVRHEGRTKRWWVAGARDAAGIAALNVLAGALLWWLCTVTGIAALRYFLAGLFGFHAIMDAFDMMRFHRRLFGPPGKLSRGATPNPETP